MAILLMIVGIGFIGYYVLSISSADKPNPPAGKMGFAVGGVVAIGVTMYSAYMVVYGPSVSASFLFVLLAIGSLVAGVKLFQAAGKADAIAASNVTDRARTIEAENRFRQAKYDRDNAESTAAGIASLETQRRTTEKDSLEYKSTEYGVLSSLAPAAEQKGLDIGSVIEVNKHFYTNEADIKKLAAEKQIEYDFRVKDTKLEAQNEAERIRQQLNAADRVEHYRIISQLEEELEGLYVKRRKIELEEPDEVLKNQKIARLNKRVDQLETDIDGRQNRLLSASNGQEVKRLT